VGHDGVILASEDAGESWRVQMQWRKGDRDAADKSFLDVWFADARTRIRGGCVQPSVSHDRRRPPRGNRGPNRVENPKQLNLHAIRPAAGALFIAGEAGLLLKLDESSQRFRAVEVPYKGSFFGIAAVGSSVLVHGLRGSAFMSPDGGRTWGRIEPGPRRIHRGLGAVVRRPPAACGRFRTCRRQRRRRPAPSRRSCFARRCRSRASRPSAAACSPWSARAARRSRA
jgi:photosystem II stability/assembly factor-like uncharacterized protein